MKKIIISFFIFFTTVLYCDEYDDCFNNLKITEKAFNSKKCFSQFKDIEDAMYMFELDNNKKLKEFNPKLLYKMEYLFYFPECDAKGIYKWVDEKPYCTVHGSIEKPNFDKLLNKLIKDGFVSEKYKCPNGGQYLFTRQKGEIRLWCTKHGYPGKRNPAGYIHKSGIQISKEKCVNYMKTIEIAIDKFNIVHDSNNDIYDDDFALLLKNKGYIKEVMHCPQYGEYSFKDGVMTCTIHGETDTLPYFKRDIKDLSLKKQMEYCVKKMYEIDLAMTKFSLDFEQFRFSVTDMQKNFDVLIERGYIKEIPKCPNNGEYIFENGQIKCTIHNTVHKPKIDEVELEFQKKEIIDNLFR